MRTLDNVSAGMPAAEARQDAIRRFGDFERIRKACRRTLLGERIMLQRVQAVLTLILLGAVVFMGVALYRGQQANEAATARMMQILDNLVGPSVVQTMPKSGDNDVDPSLTEIRVTYNKPMMDGSWSWCYDPEGLKTNGNRDMRLMAKRDPASQIGAGKDLYDFIEYQSVPQLQGHGRTICGPLCAAIRHAARGDGGRCRGTSARRPSGQGSAEGGLGVSGFRCLGDRSGHRKSGIKFDRPMDPDRIGLHGDPIKAPTPFRLHGSHKIRC